MQNINGISIKNIDIKVSKRDVRQGTLFCFLFDLILYVPVNSFSVISGRVFLG